MNGDGTCYVSGIGNCKDTDIVIPTKSPEGYTVTAIGDWAFSVCSSLTTINYRGTEEQWNAISNGSYWGSYTDKYTIVYG